MTNQNHWSKKPEIKNAVIESGVIDIHEGYLNCSLHLIYGDFHQSFGGWTLYLPKDYKHHRLESGAGHFIYRVMEIAQVTKFNDLKGKSIRAQATSDKVYAIGHIIKEDWFCPSEDFASLNNKEDKK